MTAAGLQARLASLARPPRVRVVVIVAVLLRLALIAVAAGRVSTSSDLSRYHDIATGGVPYRDQQVEYPPVAVLLIDGVHLVAHSPTAYGIAFILVMALVEAATCVCMWRAFGSTTGIAFLFLSSVVYSVMLTRIDILPTALAVAFLALATGRRPVGAGIAWASAVGAKIWPLPLGIFLVLPGQSASERRRGVVAAVISGAVLAGGWLAVGGVDGIGQVLSYRGAPGWQIESMVGAVVHLTGSGAVAFEQGTYRIGSVPPGAGLVLQLAGTAGAIATCVFGARRGRPGTAWLAAVLCLLATSTLLSPQFLIWAIPGAALTVRERGLLPAALATLTIAATVLETSLYPAIVDGSRVAQLVLLGRNLLLLVTLGAALRALVKRRTDSDPPGLGDWPAAGNRARGMSSAA